MEDKLKEREDRFFNINVEGHWHYTVELYPSNDLYPSNNLFPQGEE